MKQKRKPTRQKGKPLWGDMELDDLLVVSRASVRPRAMLFYGTASEWRAITKGARDFLRLRRKAGAR